MPNQTFEELTIKATFDKNSATKGISALSKSIQNLKKVADNISPEMSKSFKAIGTAVNNIKVDKKVINDLERLADSLKTIASANMNKINKQVGETIAEEKPKTLGFETEQGTNAITTYTNLEEQTAELTKTEEAYYGVKDAISSMNYQIDKATSNTKKLEAEQKRANKESKSFIQTWGERMVSVASYRMIRRAIQLIIQMCQEGLQNVAQVDEGVNEAMSNLKNSYNQLKNSLGATLGYLVEIVEPVLTMLMDGLSALLDYTSQITAAMNGNTTYQKAIKTQEDYAESLEKTKSAMTGIDELNTISNETTADEMFEETEISGTASALGSLMQSLKKCIDMLDKLNSAVSGDGGLFDVFNNLFGECMPEWWNTFYEGFSEVSSLITDFGSNIMGTITDLINGDIDSIVARWKSWWNSFTEVMKPAVDWFREAWASVCNWFTGAWNKVVGWFESVINWFIRGINKMFGWLGVNIEEINWTGESVEVQPYASGGYVNEGQLFIAREAGAEMVGSVGGRTAVLNNEDIVAAVSEGVYNAVIDASNDSERNVEVKVYVDGKEIRSRTTTNNGSAVYQGGI